MVTSESSPVPVPEPRLWWRVSAYLVAGVLMTTGATLIARATNLGDHLMLDFSGVHAQGTAIRQGNNAFLLRYESTDGAIYRRSFRGRLPKVGDDPTREYPIDVVYDPQKPGDFQPARITYLPGAVAGSLLLVALVCALRARNLALRRFRHRPPVSPKRRGA